MFRNCAPYLKEWVEYHRLVGVEHFWLYNHESTDNWEEILEPYIKEGLVEVFYWQHDGSGNHISRQMEAFRNGLSLARNNTKWIALIDLDEFLLPLKYATITETLKNHFSDVSAVYINWRHFGTSGITVPLGKPFLCHLTRCSLKAHSQNGIGKSIVKPGDVEIKSIWYPHHVPLKPGCKYVNGEGGEMEKFGFDNLKADGKHYDKYMRINHYIFRDEYFFQNFRLPTGYGFGGNKELLMEQYNSFSLMKDYAIINYLKKYHPKEFEKIWKNGE